MKVQQAKAIVSNFLNVYQFALTELDNSDGDLITIGRERYKFLGISASLNSLALYETTILKNENHPVLLVDSIYTDFLVWIETIEKMCEDTIAGISINLFDELFKESYASVYEEHSENKNSAMGVQREKANVDSQYKTYTDYDIPLSDPNEENDDW